MARRLNMNPRQRMSQAFMTLMVLVILSRLGLLQVKALDLSSLVTHPNQGKELSLSNGNGATGLVMGTLMRYFDSAMNPQPSSLLTNWSPDDDTKKIKILRDLANQASELISNYQSNGLQNAPSLPLNIPGFGSVMRTPDKVLRAELSMLQDLIRMAQKMTQNPISATIDVPKDFATLMSRMADQIEQ